ncbi:MAG TPA: hypothetical protein VHS78_06470 [Candidatus Elarobacter sp.]|jgi:hypothetical protein|nr:hypothetical protein [Candidatus Elarobacter sp.]
MSAPDIDEITEEQAEGLSRLYARARAASLPKPVYFAIEPDERALMARLEREEPEGQRFPVVRAVVYAIAVAAVIRALLGTDSGGSRKITGEIGARPEETVRGEFLASGEVYRV